MFISSGHKAFRSVVQPVRFEAVALGQLLGNLPHLGRGRKQRVNVARQPLIVISERHCCAAHDKQLSLQAAGLQALRKLLKKAVQVLRVQLFTLTAHARARV